MAPLKFDLHLHSSASNDCLMDAPRIRDVGIARGLAGAAITDHNAFTRVPRGLSDGRFVFVPGEEIKTTDRGDVIALFLKEEIRPAPLARVLSEIRRQDALAIAPHPFDSLGRSAVNPTRGEAAGFDAIEIFNARCVRSGDNKKALKFAFDSGLPSVGGSDAHFYSEIGNAVTLAEMPAHAGAEGKLALLRGAISEGKTSAVLLRKTPLTNRLGTSVTRLRKRVLGL